MKITIDDDALNKVGITIEEFLLWYLYMRGSNLKELEHSLFSKNLISYDNNEFILIGEDAIKETHEDGTLLSNEERALFQESIKLSQHQKNLLSSVLVDSNGKNIRDDWFLKVAKEMRELFPQGKKPGTPYYWRDSITTIIDRLKNLKKKYKAEFTEQEAIDATKSYVESFNGDYRYMQLLKYFIYKMDGPEIRSDFLSYIANRGQVDSNNDSWQTHLV